MVIGSGMIATRFTEYSKDSKFVIFASGVSNSGISDPAPFLREEKLLRSAIADNPDKTLVYFSTCSIYDPSMHHSAYVLHKLKMEAIIEKHSSSYNIFRVSNPIEKSNNPNTVLNFFIQHIREKSLFAIWKYASRNLIDIDDMFAIIDHILQQKLFRNSIVNIANPVNYPVTIIIRAIESHFSTTGVYEIAEKGNSPFIDTTVIQPIFSQLNINFDNQYLPNLLQKHFPLP